MADSTGSDDFSALWGPEGEVVLEPVGRRTGNGAGSGHEPGPDEVGHANGNGAHPMAADQAAPAAPEETVARLAAALTGQRDVIPKTDLDVLRRELEGAFTHRLAVGMYELLTASNERLAATEDRMNGRIGEAEESHANRLAAALGENRRAFDEMATAVQERLDATVAALAAFQRELRHEVGRLGDVAVGAGQPATGSSAPVASSGDGKGRSGSDIGAIVETLMTLRDDVASLREEVAGIRQSLESERHSRLG